MKKIIFTLSTLGLLAIISCGPSAEEKAAAEKRKADSTATAIKQQMDSIAKATEQATKLKMETKLALQDSIKNTTMNKEYMEMELSEAKADLEAAKDGMGKIKEWQLGRTPAEREQQIKNQTYKIDGLEKQIENLKTDIRTAKQKIIDFETELKKYQ